MNAHALSDDIGLDLEDVAQQAFDSRPSISCTPSCRGCNDPQCGYCEEYEEAMRPQRVAAEAEKIKRSNRDLLDMFRDLLDDEDIAVAGSLRAAVNHDYIAAGERICNLLTPKINQLAESQA